MQGIITDIQRFCVHDGPGIRTTVFLKGCPLDCFWCHNPETKSPFPQVVFAESLCKNCGKCGFCQNHKFINGKHLFELRKCAACFQCVSECEFGAISICGKEITADEVVETALRDLPFYCDGGGITISGGEPFFQPEFTIEVLKKAKAKSLNTCVETCGSFDSSIIPKLVGLCDLVLFDIKDTDSERLEKNTGGDLEKIVQNLKILDANGIKTQIRCIILKGINDDEKHKEKAMEIFKMLDNCEGISFFPCRELGASKHSNLGIKEIDLKKYIY